MKIACIYHSIDLDGWMSAAIVKHWWELNTKMQEGGSRTDRIEFLSFNYGDPIPDLSEYDKVIMCDISFPAKIMKELHIKLTAIPKEPSNFIWLDHHISAIKAMENEYPENSIPISMPFGFRDTNFAACELTWQYFFPNETMPEIVRLLGRYDCFGHKNTDEELKVLEFQYGARQMISNYEHAYNWLLLDADPVSPIDTIKIRGEIIYKYLCTEAKQSYKNGFDIEFDNPNWDTPSHFPGMNLKLKFICINKERFNPINFGIDYHKDGYDGCACFHYANGKYNFSLYNDNGLVDCSIIAKQFGGGGHKGAAGFILTQEQFDKLIN